MKKNKKFLLIVFLIILCISTTIINIQLNQNTSYDLWFIIFIPITSTMFIGSKFLAQHYCGYIDTYYLENMYDGSYRYTTIPSYSEHVAYFAIQTYKKAFRHEQLKNMIVAFAIFCQTALVIGEGKIVRKSDFVAIFIVLLLFSVFYFMPITYTESTSRWLPGINYEKITKEDLDSLYSQKLAELSQNTNLFDYEKKAKAKEEVDKTIIYTLIEARTDKSDYSLTFIGALIWSTIASVYTVIWFFGFALRGNKTFTLISAAIIYSVLNIIFTLV
jgi:hypothetical protein